MRLGEGERLLRSGRPWAWAPNFLLGLELAGTPLGVLGMGRIGQAVARRARAFDMPVGYHNRRELPPEQAEGAEWLPLEELLARSTVLVVTCPLGPATRHLLDARRLALLPPGAVVVSMTAGVVDEEALAAALESGALFAAAVDNFEREPHGARRAARPGAGGAGPAPGQRDRADQAGDGRPGGGQRAGGAGGRRTGHPGRGLNGSGLPQAPGVPGGRVRA